MAADFGGEGHDFVEGEEVDVGAVSHAAVYVVGLLDVREGPWLIKGVQFDRLSSSFFRAYCRFIFSWNFRTTPSFLDSTTPILKLLVIWQARKIRWCCASPGAARPACR